MLANVEQYFDASKDSPILYYYTYLEPTLIDLKKQLGNRLQLFENSENHILAEEHLTAKLTPPNSIIFIDDVQSDLLSSNSQQLRRSMLRLYQVMHGFAVPHPFKQLCFRGQLAIILQQSVQHTNQCLQAMTLQDCL